MGYELHTLGLGIALMALGLLACESVTSDSHSYAPFIAEGQPTSLKGLDLGTENKPKRDLVTPYGVKQVYDPHQDPAVRIVFKEYYEEKHKSGYFDKWPRDLIERSQRKPSGGINMILLNARGTQLGDYRYAGCGRPQTLRCLLPPSVPLKGCPRGVSKVSECKDSSFPDDLLLPMHPAPKYKLCPFDGELPSVSRPRSLKSGLALPFHRQHIGDPKRGTMQQQFDQYFAIHCNEFFDIESRQELKP